MVVLLNACNINIVEVLELVTAGIHSTVHTYKYKLAANTISRLIRVIPEASKYNINNIN